MGQTPGKRRIPFDTTTASGLLGQEVQRARAAMGMSLEALAAQMPHSKSAIHRVEQGTEVPTSGMAEHLDRALDGDGLFGRLCAFARHQQEMHPEKYRPRMVVEQRARDIREYGGMLIPGLLQTEPYARSLFVAHKPHAAVEEIDRLTSARMERQTVLTTAHVSIILDESAVRRQHSEPGVMREQLAAIAERTLGPSLTVQLLPFSHGEHAMLGGTVTIMTLDDDTAVVYDEGAGSGSMVSDPAEVESRTRAFDLLRSCAMTPAQTADALRSAMEDHPS